MTHWESLSTWGRRARPRYPLHPPGPNRPHWKVREAATCWLPCPSPKPMHHHPECLYRVSISCSGRREPSTVGCFVGATTLTSLHEDLRWIFSPTLGLWLWWRSGEGFATASMQILADQVHTCSAQVVIPTSTFAHLQNQKLLCTLTRQLSRVLFCLI